MSHYICISAPTEKMIEELGSLADKAGAALIKSSNATKEFFRRYPDAVGNPEEVQGIISHLPGMGDFGALKKDGSAFKQTFLGLDNALRKGTAEVSKGWVIWRGAQYSYKYCLFGVALVNAARKQAGKASSESATPTSKKATREELASLISGLIALCDEHEVKKDKRYKLLVSKWKEMQV